MKNWFVIIAVFLGYSSVACSQVKPQRDVDIVDSLVVKDSLIYVELIERAKHESWQNESLPTIEIKVATYFLGVPYVGKTLEADGQEHLVVNLREFDCTTYLENVVVIALCIKNRTTNFAQYKAALTRLRYRNGVIDQYPSRLHYFTDWLVDNQQKGLLTIVSEQFGSQPFRPSVGFMSANPDKYKALTNHSEFVPIIAAQEAMINSRSFLYIPKHEVSVKEGFIHDGDLIAITTSLAGLDIVHVGIACFKNGRLHLLHASSTLKKVVMTQVPLADYLTDIKIDTGIMVARLLAE